MEGVCESLTVRSRRHVHKTSEAILLWIALHLRDMEVVAPASHIEVFSRSRKAARITGVGKERGDSPWVVKDIA